MARARTRVGEILSLTQKNFFSCVCVFLVCI
jgi:hypothetical protein